jgi:hypothetical protein
MSVVSYHFSACGFPEESCICNAIQSDINENGKTQLPRNEAREYHPAGKLHYKDCPSPLEACDCDVIQRPNGWLRNRRVKEPCMILDLEGNNPTTAILDEHAPTIENYKAACRDMLTRLFPGADLRFVGPIYSVNQEAPAQNRYTARFGFPYDKIYGRGANEIDAYQELYKNMYEKINATPTPDLSFTQNYCQNLDRENPEAFIPLADLEKAREEATAALADTGEVQDEKKYIELTADWPAPEVGPLVQVGSVSYDDSELEHVALPQANPAFIRGYEFVTPDYSFVQSVDTQPKVDTVRGNWYPLVRLAAYEKLQATVKGLTVSLLAEQQETAAAEERAEKFRQQVVNMRITDDDNGIPIASLTAGLQAALAGYGQIIVQAAIHSRYRKAEEQRDYLAAQSLVIRWNDGLPYVAQLVDATSLAAGNTAVFVEQAICGYNDSGPVVYPTIEAAVDGAMQILPHVKDGGQ